MKIGYARTSREDQRLDLQINALHKDGIEDNFIFKEQVSALAKKRPQFDLALKRCRRGDTLVVWKLDRLGRSVMQLIGTVNDLKERGVHFKSITEQFDTNAAIGTMLFHIMAVMAQLERDHTAERTQAGIEAAKERETYTTRSLTFTKAEWAAAIDAFEKDPSLTVKQVSDASGLKKGTVHRNKDDLKAGISFETRFPFEKNRGKASGS